MSPYKRVGKTVYKKVDGLKRKGKSKSVTKAKRHLNVLRGVEHGWRLTGKSARDTRKYSSAWKGGKKHG